MRGAVSLGAMLGLGGTEVFFTVMLLGLALFGAVGWWLLRWIGRRYQMVALMGFMLTGAGHRRNASATLLLLRVFALGNRSERLFDALSKRWLRVGSISMIAGPDLVSSTVEPHEFLDFIGRRLSRRFVRSSEDLSRRLKAMNEGPDPDGRYRVNEFFCYADTWKPTMATLAVGADVVLMDLRSFSPSNQGGVFELEQLLDSVQLSRVVFLLDDATDIVFLEETLQAAWHRLHADSPNRKVMTPEARLLHVRSQHALEVRGLLQLLFEPPSANLHMA